MKSIISRIPYLRYAFYYRKNSSHRPGHFHSPVVDLDDLKAREDKIWKRDRALVGIDLNAEKQESFFEDLINCSQIIPFENDKEPNHRFFYDNKSYPHADALVLFTMLNTLRPKKLIEIGSGYSSALILDTRDKFLKDSIDLTFIEPYPDLLKSLIKKEDHSTTTIIPDLVQNVPLSTFKKLEENDILLIDNSHVSKTGSDVNFLMTEVLPILNKGVIVHIHDIFYPFEYPQDWLFEHKLNWNEIFSVHNFLLFNNTYKIIFFSDYIQSKYEAQLKDKAPLLFKSRPGSLWLQRVN